MCVIAASSSARCQAPDPANLIRRVLAERNVRRQYDLYQSYSSDRYDHSAGDKSFSDKTGNCRLKWVDYLLRHQLESIAEADRFTAGLHQGLAMPFAASDIAAAWGHALHVAEKRTEIDPAAMPADQQPVPARLQVPASTESTLLAAVNRAFLEFQQALQPLSVAERQELRDQLYRVTTGDSPYGYHLSDTTVGRHLCDLMERIDHRSLFDAAHALRAATDRQVIQRHINTTGRETLTLPGASGQIQSIVNSEAGRIVVGADGVNEYHLDEMTDVAVIIDTGGDDIYREGTTTAIRPLLVIVDFAGDDLYQGEKPGIQGGAIVGLSLLVDFSGNDRYQAIDIAQGSSLAGIGTLIDLAGNDSYLGDRRVQGSAFGGAAMLLDAQGNDDYRAALLSQAVGGPLGFGLLEDISGNDHYYAGGKYANSYGDSPGFDGWSQGMGIGPRGTANGGIGVLLDGTGDDLYECDYFSHAGGYWFAAGFVRDFGGNDRRIGATRTNFDGSPREVSRFLRWGVGFGCHFASGFLFDDEGDDIYQGDHASVAYSWDIGVGAIIDTQGNDLYQATSSGVAESNNAAVALLLDGAGNDTYLGNNIGAAGAKIEYHPQDLAGGNFTFLLDLGGTDTYNDSVQNDYQQERGWSGGFLIDQEADQEQ
ncbi:MAG: hypothetical protein CMJ81_20325 [Planctomycetaceae bacterium]|nr:hypothetical protein [Planctomycetaceae bacterium]MBP63621.1 hypothetical protein [Planctomycetaceae bacterium]